MSFVYFVFSIGYAGENALPRYDGVAYDTIKNNAKKFGLMEVLSFLFHTTIKQ